LHELYKSELRPNKQNVDKKVVINYINSLEPAQLMFVINNANSGANDDETNDAATNDDETNDDETNDEMNE